MSDDRGIAAAFAARIEGNYADFVEEWLSFTPEDLIAYAEEIAVIKHLSETAAECVDAATMEHLLKFENPLELLFNHYPALKAFDKYAMPDLIDDIMGNHELEQEHELAEAPTIEMA